MSRMNPNWRHGRAIAAVMAVAVTAVLLAGCSSGESSQAAGTTSAPRSELVVLDPGAFAATVAEPDVVVVNVHVPYEGELEGTDAFIPFDQIVEHPDLPKDRATPIALYCLSGNMSGQAGRALIAAGYRNVSHLAGGMNAWQGDGREAKSTPPPT